MSKANDRSVECEECGRRGADDFVMFQGEIMLCANEASCKARQSDTRRKLREQAHDDR